MIRVARHNPCARIAQMPTAKPCHFAAATVICAGTGNEYPSCNQASDPMPLSELTGGPFRGFTAPSGSLLITAIITSYVLVNTSGGETCEWEFIDNYSSKESTIAQARFNCGQMWRS